MSDDYTLIGVKNGMETVLGTVTQSAESKARELVAEMFGPWEQDDGSDAEMAFTICAQLLEWMPKNPPTIKMLVPPGWKVERLNDEYIRVDEKQMAIPLVLCIHDPGVVSRAMWRLACAMLGETNT